MKSSTVSFFALTACSTYVKTEEETQWDGHEFSVNCEVLQEHFVTTPTSAVEDWTENWRCFQEENN